MGVDTTTAADHPTTDALAYIEDPSPPAEPPSPAYLKLGTSPYAVTVPPERGEFVYMQVKLECVGKTEKTQADGKVRHERAMACRKMWPIDEDEPADPPKKKTKKQLKAEEAERRTLAEAEAKGQDPLPLNGAISETADSEGWEYPATEGGASDE